MNTDHMPPLPTAPTTASPGSAEKVAIMSQRYSQGYAVFHPRDWPPDLYTDHLDREGELARREAVDFANGEADD